MTALDTNILVYARRSEAPHHRQALRLLRSFAEGPGHPAHLRRMVEAGRTAGNLAHDAHVAALLREHGVREFLTADRDFARFPGIRARDPFADR